jgi:predicted amidohydrolase YtcJ
MKKAFYNACIYGQSHDAFLVEEGVFTKIGNSKDITSLADECIDLKGSHVYPGFNDSHLHVLNFGFLLDNIDLSNTKSVEELLKALKEGNDDQHPWVIARGFNNDKYPDHRYPLKQELDQLFPDKPVAVTRCCGHVMIANSKALKLAGIDKETVIAGGHIDFEKGVLEEAGLERLKQAMPKNDKETFKRYILKAADKLNSYGVTSVNSHDLLSFDDNYQNVIDAYQELAKEGKLNIRVHAQCQFKDVDQLNEFIDKYPYLSGDDHFRIGPQKILLDGSLGARTAYLSRNYPGTDKRGILSMSVEEFDSMVKAAWLKGTPSAVHSIGDGALDIILDTFEKYPGEHGIIHLQVTRKDQLKRIIENKYKAIVQTIFLDYDSSIVHKYLSDDLVDSSYAFKTLYDGTLLTNGSDCPVELPNVLKGIQMAVTRKSLSFDVKAYNPSEALSVAQAIDSYTINPAILEHNQDHKGMIREGYLADFVITDKAIEKEDVDHIKDIKILATYLGGKPVYENA